jgi:hypothetical protein
MYSCGMRFSSSTMRTLRTNGLPGVPNNRMRSLLWLG